MGLETKGLDPRGEKSMMFELDIGKGNDDNYERIG